MQRKRCDLRRQQKVKREDAAVTCDERLSPTMDRRAGIRRMSRDVDEAEHSRHLASVSPGRRYRPTGEMFILKYFPPTTGAATTRAMTGLRKPPISVTVRVSINHNNT